MSWMGLRVAPTLGKSPASFLIFLARTSLLQLRPPLNRQRQQSTPGLMFFLLFPNFSCRQDGCGSIRLDVVFQLLDWYDPRKSSSTPDMFTRCFWVNL